MDSKHKTYIIEQFCIEKIITLRERLFLQDIQDIIVTWYCMMNSHVKDDGLKNIKLLKKVVEFKKLYCCPWAKYKNIKFGAMKLMPPEKICNL